MLVYLKRIGLFIGLILVQVLILNNIHVYGYATPFLYIYFIFIYNSGVGRNVLLLWAFSLGLTIDIFTNTPGINAASATFISFVRNPVLNSFTLHEDNESFYPGIASMGFMSFFKYVFVMSFAFCTVWLLIDSFSFFNPAQLLLKIISDTIVTVICILCVDAVWRR